MEDGANGGRCKGSLATSSKTRKTEIINALQCQYLLQLKICMSKWPNERTDGWTDMCVCAKNALTNVCIYYMYMGDCELVFVQYLDGANRANNLPTIASSCYRKKIACILYTSTGMNMHQCKSMNASASTNRYKCAWNCVRFKFSFPLFYSTRNTRLVTCHTNREAGHPEY